MNSKSLYAFYGSLRRGMINHRVYQQSLRFLSTDVIPGFRLYAMEEYPYAVRTNNALDLLTVEIFKVTDPGVERAIHELEIEVGYYYDEVKIRSERAGIYLYKKKGSDRLVKSGDWVEFFGSR